MSHSGGSTDHRTLRRKKAFNAQVFLCVGAILCEPIGFVALILCHLEVEEDVCGRTEVIDACLTCIIQKQLGVRLVYEAAALNIVGEEKNLSDFKKPWTPPICQLHRA